VVPTLAEQFLEGVSAKSHGAHFSPDADVDEDRGLVAALRFGGVEGLDELSLCCRPNPSSPT
jgi:hypothetical protein